MKYYYVLKEMQNEGNNKKAITIVKDKEENMPGVSTEKIKVV